MRTIAVVGAGAAGLSAAETLRAEGFDGRLLIVGGEEHPPYDRPPLSKQVLSGKWDAARTRLRDDAALASLGAEWWLGVRATGLNLAERAIALDTGESVAFDGLIVATGVRPQTLPLAAPQGVFTLRTLDDAIALRAAMERQPHVVVVGSGVLGTEFAAAARMQGLDVTIVSRSGLPMDRHFGPGIGEMVARRCRQEGIRFETGQDVAGFLDASGVVSGVRLGDGRVLEAGLVLVAIGSRPATDWLEGSGLDISDGLVCDAFCEAAPGVFGAGDVASWWHDGYGRRLRLESRMNAAEQATAAARNLLGARRPFGPVPFMWSDFFDVKLQSYGLCLPGCELERQELDQPDGRFLGLYRHGGKLGGAIGWNAVRPLRDLRQRVVEEMARDTARPEAGRVAAPAA